MTNLLNDFRVAYLQLIPRLWETFKGDVNGLKLEFGKADFEDLYRKYIDETYCYPWQRAVVRLNYEEGTQWSANWIGPNDHITIYLPTKPESFTPAQEASCLMKYYEVFPTVWGGAKEKSDDAVLQSKSAPKLMSASDGGAAGVGPLKQGLGVEEPFYELSALLLRVIALTWNDLSFRDQLVSAEQDATPLLSNFFGYNNPWNFNLLFKQEDFGFKVEKNGNATVIAMDGKTNDKPIVNEIVLNFPNAPQAESQWLTALTVYNQTGPEYPFTCI